MRAEISITPSARITCCQSFAAGGEQRYCNDLPAQPVRRSRSRYFLENESRRTSPMRRVPARRFRFDPRRPRSSSGPRSCIALHRLFRERRPRVVEVSFTGNTNSPATRL